MTRLYFWALFLLVVLGNTSASSIGLDADIVIETEILPAPFSRAAVVKYPECPTEDGGRQCNDCKNILFCKKGSKESTGMYECPPESPYCEYGKCVTSANCSDTTTFSDVYCPAESSYFPDPRNCSIFYYCNAEEKATNMYSCPPGYPFDFKNSCKRSIYCGILSCKGQRVAINPQNPRLGALCSNNEIIDSSYTLCGVSQQLNSAGDCKAKCLKEGAIPHEDDTTKFYTCLPIGPWGALVMQEMDCPSGMVFNVKNEECDD